MSDVKSVNIRDLMDIYEFPCTLLGSGKQLKIAPVTTAQLKKILTYEDENNILVVETALDELITSSVKTEDFDINSLYLQDRFQLMLEIRKVSKGNMYSFSYNCPECDVETIAAIDLSKLENIPFNIESGIVSMSDTLQFELDFPTRGDQKFAYDYVMSNGEVSPADITKDMLLDIAVAMYAKSVRKVIVNGTEQTSVPIEDIIYVIENVKTEIFENIKKWFEINTFGVNFKGKVKCINQHEKTIEIPIENFFV